MEQSILEIASRASILEIASSHAAVAARELAAAAFLPASLQLSSCKAGKTSSSTGPSFQVYPPPLQGEDWGGHHFPVSQPETAKLKEHV